MMVGEGKNLEELVKDSGSIFKMFLTVLAGFAAKEIIITSGIIEYLMRTLAVSEMMTWVLIFIFVSVYLLWRYEL